MIDKDILMKVCKIVVRWKKLGTLKTAIVNNTWMDK